MGSTKYYYFYQNIKGCIWISLGSSWSKELLILSLKLVITFKCKLKILNMSLNCIWNINWQLYKLQTFLETIASILTSVSAESKPVANKGHWSKVGIKEAIF